MDTKVIFSFRTSVFRDVRTDCNLDLRILVKEQISVIMADLSWGHINIFRGKYKRSLLTGFAKS